MKDQDKLSKLIKQAQGERTQNEYASRCGISSPSITRICSGAFNPKPSQLQKLASKAHNGVTYEMLMEAAGYLESAENAESSLGKMPKIRELREENGYTQEELGKLIGVQKSSISKYEKGFAAPSLDVLKKLAGLFKVSIDEIVGVYEQECSASVTNGDSARAGRYSIREVTLMEVKFATGRKTEGVFSEFVTDLWTKDGKLVVRIDPRTKTESL